MAFGWESELSALADLSDEAAAAAIAAMTATETYMRFVSWRTLAGTLTDTEYSAVKTVVAAQSAASQRVADMADLMGIPGNESGDGGGIDFGADATREWIDSMQTALATALGDSDSATALVAKLKSLAEKTVRKYDVPSSNMVAEARAAQ